MEIYKYEVLKDISVDYDSPFEFVTRMTDSIAQFTDDGVMKAVINAGFNVDKDKLVSALQQDKKRYDMAYKRGYTNGYKAKDDEIVRCKDCKFSKPDWEKAVWCEREDCRRHENWFCADGEREVIEIDSDL